MSVASIAALVCALALAVFAVRRALLIVAALLARRPLATSAEPPSLTLVVPARNETAALDRLLGALAGLDYDEERLFTVLVDDGSGDGTGERLAQWADGRPRALALALSAPVGKPQALNEAIAEAPPSELIAVCDADLRPQPDCFRRLAEPFADESVGLTVGYRRPENAASSTISRYAAVETWVHQLVTSAAKDRLDLNPPSLGFSVYRRAALEEIGWFRPDANDEDTDSTLALTWTGWRTRFVPDAVADNLVVDRWTDYWRQHLRWAGSFLDAARPAERRRTAPLGRQLELWLFRAGYLDRVVLVAACAFAAVGALPVWAPGAYLALPAVEVVVALGRAGVGRRAWSFLLATAAVFPLDVLASLAAVAVHPRRRQRLGWESPRRPVPETAQADAIDRQAA